MPGSPFQRHALKDVNLTVKEGDFLGIIGPTGSGKSTLIQHINGLIKLRKGMGSIKVYDIDLADKRADLLRLRSYIGMVFQYPEYQLFDETVLKDVCFGPKNFGYGKEEMLSNAKESLELVGLDYEQIKDRSPFDLSGGQKRRVAIAGVLAAKPKVLILDEPTSGLDPGGKREILNLIDSLRKKWVQTVIMISHNMDEIAEFANRIAVMEEGRIIYDSTPEEIFRHSDKLREMGLDIPHTVNIANQLREKGLPLHCLPMDTDKLTACIIKALGGSNG
jgi:energy-coupling factor transport system ATP-binding protein